MLRSRVPDRVPAHHPSGSRDAVGAPPRGPDIVCFSHLRWDFVFQRPQHLMERFARRHRVFFIEEPITRSVLQPHVTPRGPNVLVVVPHLTPELTGRSADEAQRALIDEVLARHDVRSPALWFTTPMPVPLTRHLAPRVVVYDCMDELSAFDDPPPELAERERELLRVADLVFAGGRSLYAAKRLLRERVLLFPSSVDVQHFGRARTTLPEPPDQASIPHPRLGFAGVIDERTDLALLDALAGTRPDWQIVMLGPVVKIDPATLPRRRNIHYLGFKWYQELPGYLAGWDVALLPFAHNAATRFISPTKTLEYLAAGRPVVSTSVADVVATFGRRGLVEIADGVDETATAVERLLGAAPSARLALGRAHDAHLARTSWDRTWRRMWWHMRRAMAARHGQASTARSRGGASSRAAAT